MNPSISRSLFDEVDIIEVFELKTVPRREMFISNPPPIFIKRSMGVIYLYFL